MPSDRLFAPIFVPPALREAVSDRAWLAALLEVERALAAAEARAGVIPAEAAEAIAAACRADDFDPEALALEGRRAGNPVEPLARALATAAGPEAGRYVHWGATSQDVLDSASALVARGALDLVVADLDGVARACGELADSHRETLMAARTLLQQAVPTTFGLKAAGWLVAVLDSRRRLVEIRSGRLAAQLGGAAGTLASLGEDGPAVLRLFAEELGLGEPIVPWHANRVRVAELGAALDIAAGALAKIALDVVLLAQTEVAEATESADGGSSTMPHKRNPVGATLARACASHVHAAAGLLTGGLAQEHERAAGAWHAEWHAFGDALAFAGGAASWTRAALEGLQVDPERMRRNLDASEGLLVAERAAFVLADRLSRQEAHALVREAAGRAAASGGRLADELLADPRIAEHATPAELEATFDPAAYLGSAGVFVERALAALRAELGPQA